ncbi:pentapeptide repeat-containing protein [Candidatus Leptofilum sp.]|uniref:pentapeptide repeat-containing protein n=1 Tax=Candidatus Leptofilum sp. TaxID=3241576 RepID=UPI003B5ABB92
MNQAEDQNNPKIENLQLSTSGSGAAANDGGVAAGKMGIAIKGDIQGDVHYHGLIEEKTSIPHQGPPPPPNYIPREQEIALIETLCQEGNQITLIQGESGVGKTSLAASLVDHFQAEEYFNDGILWGDMSETDAHEQLWYFADSIGLKQRVGAKSHTLPRDLFWNALVDKQVLLVLDNITDSKIVEQIVSPSLSTGKWKKCRILLIAIPNQKFEISIDYQLSLDPFSNEEAEAFFKKALDGSILNQYSDILFDIAQELNFYPNTIVAATQKFIRGDGNPYTYLQQLRLAEKQPQEIYRAFWEAHSLNIQGLSDDQIRLLELTAVLSTADFSYEMIAAIALRKPTEIQHELNGLVQRGLLQVTDKERFTRNLDFHEFLKSRLQAWANYELQAAYHLLARYCIDLAHDLAEKYGLNTALIADSISVSRYQRELLDEMPHFRKIFNWALEQSDWQILRRFAHYPYFGLLRDLFTNSFYTRFSFEMATIANVLVTHNGRQSIFHVKECIGNSHGLWPAIRPGKYLFGINGDIRTHARYSKEFERPSIGLSSRTRRRAGRHILGDKITGDIYSLDGVSDQLSSEPTRPELSLNFYASHTVNLQFSQVDIIDTVWVAVHAHNLNFYRISFVGTHFLGCYLQHSGFFECEARGIDFSGSDLSGSVFRDVDFRGAIFTNTILKDTVFDNVDLRGSNLKGANFSGAAIKHTNLDGCNLIDTVWKDVTGTPLLSDEDRLFAKHIFQPNPQRSSLKPSILIIVHLTLIIIFWD